MNILQHDKNESASVVYQLQPTMWSQEQTCNDGYVTKQNIKFILCIDDDLRDNETHKVFHTHHFIEVKNR